MHAEQMTVFVVDDDTGVRESLQFLLESVGHRVEAYPNAAAMIERCVNKPSGCLVVDLRLPGMSGLDMHDRLVDMGVSLPAIVITGHGDVSVAVRAMKAGVIDFLEKPFSDQDLLDRVAQALEIHAQDQVLAQARAQLNARHAQLTARYAQLTPRESQVMRSVVEGRLNKQIAAELGLSHKTIEVHRAHVMEKMAASSLAELVRMAVVLEDIKVEV